MCLCSKCKHMTVLAFLIFGILFLLRDLGVWNFWNIQPWTVLFIAAPLIAGCSSHCPMCREQNCCADKLAKKKR